VSCVISVYFNIRNTLPKSGTFLLGHPVYGPEWLSHYGDWLRNGRSGDRIAVVSSFSAPFHTDPWAHPAPNTMGTESLPVVKRSVRRVNNPHSFSAGFKDTVCTL